MTITKVLLGAAVIGTIVTGGIAVDSASAPEAQAACWGQITPSKGKNYTGCGKAQHFDRLTNGTMKWGTVVGANKWSHQAACWANIDKWGMVRA